MKVLPSRAFLKYLTVGVMAFMAEYGSFFALFVLAGVNLTIANGLSYIIGMITSFGLNRLWTFQTKEYSKKMARQFGYYFALAGINLILTLLIVEFLKRAGLDPKIGKFIAMVVTSLWNFVLFKLFIFNSKPITKT